MNPLWYTIANQRPARPMLMTAVLAVLASGTVAIPAATMTDQFYARPVVEGISATLDGNTSTAGIEVGEPNSGGGRQHSVWGAWRAPANGVVTMDTFGSSFDTVLAVFTGTVLNALRPVAWNDNVPNTLQSWLKYPVKAGETYVFCVDGRNNTFGSQGGVRLNISLSQADQPGSEVGTDSFAGRPTLPSALRAIGVCSTHTFSLEAFEPPRVSSRDKTAWWRWVSPTNGLATLHTLDSEFNTVVTVYAGTNFAELQEAWIGDDAPNVNQSYLQFPVRRGQEYQIMVDGVPDTESAEGNVVLDVSVAPDFGPGAVPGSDFFARRSRLEGSRAVGIASSFLYTREVFEPLHGSSRGHTAWWEWTAPRSGMTRVRTEGSSFDTFLAIYTGSTVGALALVTNNNNASGAPWSEVAFPATAGTRYAMMVDGYLNTASANGNILLRVDQAVPVGETLAIYPAVEIEMPGVNGVSYQLQGSYDLMQWDSIGVAVMGRGEPIRILDAARSPAKRFYRYEKIP